MANYVNTYLDVALLQNITNTANDLNEQISSSTVKITDDKKKGVRTMAEGREGFARLVSKIANQHVDSLSRADDPKALETALAYDANLETARQALIKLVEKINDTQWGNSADIMVMADRFVQSLQVQRVNNGALDTALNQIDEYNSRFGGSGNTAPKGEAE